MTELEALASGPISQFRDWPNPAVPLVSAGVYTVWDGAQLIYAGMAGRALTRDAILAGRQTTLVKGLRQRLASARADVGVAINSVSMLQTALF